jgi:membrane-bound ClpP family serine protease
MNDFSTGALSTHEPPVDLKREGLKYGVLNGLFAMLIMYGSYFVGFDFFVTTQFTAGFIPYMMIILIIVGFQLRRRNGGYLAFKEAIRFAFLSYVVAAVIIAIGTYILYNVVDKNLTQKTFEASLEKTRQMMQRLNAPQAEINSTLEKMQGTSHVTDAKTIFLGLGIGLILDFVKSMIISIIIRREKPALN